MKAVNNNSNPNAATTEDRVWWCPRCGSASVNASTLAGGAASCNVCDWKGAVEELLTSNFQHDLGSPEAVAHTFFLDVRRAISPPQFSVEICKLLIKWGFMSSPNPQVLARYMGAIAKGMVGGIIHERQAIERERIEKERRGG